MISNN